MELILIEFTIVPIVQLISVTVENQSMVWCFKQYMNKKLIRVNLI